MQTICNSGMNEMNKRMIGGIPSEIREEEDDGCRRRRRRTATDGRRGEEERWMKEVGKRGRGKGGGEEGERGKVRRCCRRQG